MLARVGVQDIQVAGLPCRGEAQIRDCLVVLAETGFLQQRWALPFKGIYPVILIFFCQ